LKFLKKVISLFVSGKKIKKHLYSSYKQNEVKKHLYSSFKQEEILHKKFVNLGSGIFHHPHWTCVDIGYDNDNMYPNGFPKDYINLNFNDTNMQLPFANDSISIFYSSHCIEHLANEAIKNLLEESFRCLKKGGLIRITCPDINLALNAIENNNKYFFDPNNTTKKNILELFFSDWVDPICKRYMDYDFLQKNINNNNLRTDKFLDELFEPKEKRDLNGHINYLHENKLFEFLKNAGYKKIYGSRYQQSISPVFLDGNYFEKNYQNMSLYVEAIK